ncbi:hypothetical protein ACI2KR_09205 [Pseudomonas luteola]
MNAVAKNTIDDIFAAAQVEENENGALQLLIGLGIETGVSLDMIDGIVNFEPVYELIGEIFFVKDMLDEEHKKLSTHNPETDFIARAVACGLHGIHCYMNEADALEQAYHETLTLKREMASGKGKVVMLRPAAHAHDQQLMPVGTPIRPLSKTYGCGDITTDEAIEFFTGMGIKTANGLEQIETKSLRQCLKRLVMVMSRLKVTLQPAIDEIENLLVILPNHELAKTYGCFKALIKGIEIREDQFQRRINEHNLYASGKVVSLFGR